jgi:hypothetical protein
MAFLAKENLMMLRTIMTCFVAVSLAACATTPEPGSAEFAYCERMEREMGTEHRHDHAEARGMGMNPMNVTHDRCRRMLAEGRSS